MNLRILKKLSKKAVPLLGAIEPRGGYDKWFKAGRDENYHGLRIEKPHGESHRHRFSFTSDRTALKGTPMYGGMDGGEEPEWWEETAWGILCNLVRWSNIDDTERDDDGLPVFKLKAGIVLGGPSDYLREALIMARAKALPS